MRAVLAPPYFFPWHCRAGYINHFYNQKRTHSSLGTGDIPVQTDEFELVINSKMAAALSVKVPERVLARATKMVDRLHSERHSRFRTALGGLRAT
jgi:hypothetical protein